MGTRADFYVGRGSHAEWLGSIAWDGYVGDDFYVGGVPVVLLSALDVDRWRYDVAAFLATRKDGTTPEMGWPWPWDDSRTTDYAYAFDGGKVWASGFGHDWFDPLTEDPDEDAGRTAVFPDMSARKVVTYGSRSGVMLFGPAGPVPGEIIDAEERDQ